MSAIPAVPPLPLLLRAALLLPLLLVLLGVWHAEAGASNSSRERAVRRSLADCCCLWGTDAGLSGGVDGCRLLLLLALAVGLLLLLLTVCVLVLLFTRRVSSTSLQRCSMPSMVSWAAEKSAGSSKRGRPMSVCLRLCCVLERESYQAVNSSHQCTALTAFECSGQSTLRCDLQSCCPKKLCAVKLTCMQLLPVCCHQLRLA